MFINTGLIGYPLGHSYSALLHSYFYSYFNINGGYTNYEIESAQGIKELITYLIKYKFTGVNVTVPYKIDIMNYCECLDSSALEVKSVNTVHFTEGKIHGYNTDLYGFSRMLEENDISTRGKRVLLLGAGGAARAVAAHLKKSVPIFLVISNRTISKAEYLADKCFFSVETIPFKELKGIEFDIIINATSMGLNNDYFEDVGAECREAAVDLQYSAVDTQFLKYYKDKKVKRVNGLSMLIWQAYKAFSIWNNIDSDTDIDIQEVYKILSDKIYQK